MRKTILLATIIFAAAWNPVFAHVVVQPASVEVGAFQTFTVSVPVEKDQPTIALRLIVPEGLRHVTPTVQPGWTIRTVRSGDVITEIIWQGGSIPAGQRDDFTFSAQAPAAEDKLVWKAYQTYRDGTVVAWADDPGLEHTDFSTSGPFSVTVVVNDLTPSKQYLNKANAVLILSIIALFVSVLGVFRRKRSGQ